MKIGGLDLGVTASPIEWAYTLTGLVTILFTLVAFGWAIGNQRYQRHVSELVPGSNQAERAIARSYVITRALILLMQGGIVTFGVASLVTAPPTRQAAYTPLNFMLGLTLIGLLLLMALLSVYTVAVDRHVRKIVAAAIAEQRKESAGLGGLAPRQRQECGPDAQSRAEQSREATE